MVAFDWKGYCRIAGAFLMIAGNIGLTVSVGFHPICTAWSVCSGTVPRGVCVRALCGVFVCDCRNEDIEVRVVRPGVL